MRRSYLIQHLFQNHIHGDFQLCHIPLVGEQDDRVQCFTDVQMIDALSIESKDVLQQTWELFGEFRRREKMDETADRLNADISNLERDVGR